MRDEPDARATAGGLGALLLWSATFALARSLSEQLGPVTAGAAAYLVGGGFRLLRLATAPRPPARLRELPARYVWGCGGLFVAHTTAIYLHVAPGLGVWTGCALLVLGSVLSWRSVAGNAPALGPPPA